MDPKASPEPPSEPRADPGCTLACVELPAFALQLLLVERPEWRRDLPIVVVDEDRPQGLVTHVNHAARLSGILPGQRYAHALGLARLVRAGVVPPGAVGAGVMRVLGRLRRFSPHIEPSEDEPGLFWLDVSGLSGLYDTRVGWCREVQAALAAIGFEGFIALGFTRFGSYAAVKSLGQERGDGARASRVMQDPAAEKALAMRVPLAYLAIAPGVRDRLERMAVRTLGELMALPAAGVMKRWGPEAHALHRLAQSLAGRERVGALPGLDAVATDRLTPVAEVLPMRARAILDYLEHDAHRLLFRTKSMLDELLPLVRARGQVVAELVLELGFEGAGPGRAVSERTAEIFVAHRFRPAAPTLDGPLLIDLVRLRLEGIDLTRGVLEVRLEAFGVPAGADQMRLFPAGRHQDTAAAARALARIQAELGETAVGTLALRDAHLPRARQIFEPLVFTHGERPERKTRRVRPAEPAEARAERDDALVAPRAERGDTPKRSGGEPAMPTDAFPPHLALVPAPAASASHPVLVRRLHLRPMPLPPRPRELRNDGWQPRDPAQGAIVAVYGPFVVDGGWWLARSDPASPERPGERAEIADGSEVHREYAYVLTHRGDALWIYHDRKRRRWLEEGYLD